MNPAWGNERVPAGFVSLKTAAEYYRTGNYAGCLVQLDKLESWKPDAASAEEMAYYRAASVYELGNENREALLKDFTEKYSNSRFYDRAMFLLGNISFLKNSYKMAVENYEKVDLPQLSAKEADACRYRLAFSHLSTDNPVAARKLFGEVGKSSVFAGAARYYLAWFDYREKKFEEARAGFEASKSYAELLDNASFYIAQIDFVQRKYPAVIRYIETNTGAIRNNDMAAETARIAGESYSFAGDTAKAIQYLTLYAQKESTPLYSSMYLLGRMHFNKKSYSQAVKYLQMAISPEEPLNQLVYYYIGQSNLKLNDKKSALMAFEAASKSSSDLKIKELALYNYAMLLHENSYSPFNESVVVFEQFLNTFPQSTYTDQVSNFLSEVYLTAKNYEAALKSIQKIKQPNTKILAAKQRVLFQLGAQSVIDKDADNAMKYFSPAISLGKLDNDAYSDAFFWVGEIYYRQNNYIKATQNYTTYINETNGSNRDNLALAYYNLGYCYFRMKDYAKAQSNFEKQLTTNNLFNAGITGDALNRLGDCRYQARDYSGAENYYASAAQTSVAVADYALFQQAMMRGILKKYNAKIELLDKIYDRFPQSDYRDDALYEKARALELLDQKEMAVKSYVQLTKEFPQSELTRDAGVQMGMLYFGMGNTEKSVEWYKYTMSTFPTSEEATVANEDLKRIFKDLNKIDEYAAFLKTLDGKVQFSSSEQDSLMYLGAEKAYMKNDIATATTSLGKYLAEFPDGVFSLNANHYLATLSYNNEDTVQAGACFRRILNRADNKFTENALQKMGEMQLARNDYKEAYLTYEKLDQKASSQKSKTVSRIGLMRSAWQTAQYPKTVSVSTLLINDPKTTQEMKEECYYYRAKSYIALNQTQNIAPDLAIIAINTRSIYGAEARFLLAEHYFKSGSTTSAEKEIFDFIDKGTPHQHWLARCFILLTDIYISRNDLFQARQYLISLKNNYKQKDEVISKMIEERMTIVEPVKPETSNEAPPTGM